MRNLRPIDALVILFLTLLTVFFPIAAGLNVNSLLLFGTNALIVAGIFGLGAARVSSPANRTLSLVRNFYPIPMIIVVYKEVHVIIQTIQESLQRGDFDALFISADRWLFGVDPTVWLSRFSHPVITEILQISYTSYYFLMLIVGVELYRRESGEGFSSFMFCITYGFFLSYIGYIALPGVGPRFTLHDFGSLNTELPGLFLTNFLRDAINAGESIPVGAVNPMALAQRDVFPSGHTQMMLLTMFFAWKHLVRSRTIVTILGVLMIVSTVYLRYHYVVDLIGGALFALATVITAPYLLAYWKTLSGSAQPRA